MTKENRKSVSDYRKRQADAGLRRVEVMVPKGDRVLIRRVAATLQDEDDRSRELRQVLRGYVLPPPDGGLKQLLTAAPLEGVDLERSLDDRRAIDL